ncbi:30S ribosomal protein S5 [Candidatus Pacearchaeota archaeon]|jgi:small subunit ribosomal protein S5|nr:30S ribosomal protein S5 [Candidatus Pacearchaeota archaeon]|tara:strand:- start:2361 stop:3134 length:774 start_codon:yes stop_codon:yes gene_type:complete
MNKEQEEKKDETKVVETPQKETAKKPEGNKRRNQLPTREEIISAWSPKTKLGHDVKDGKIKNIDEILDNNKKILEYEIVDSLLNVKSDLLSIGQSKGKFGGGKRRAWRQTQRKTKEGNVPTFSTLAVIGDENGHVGVGSGKSNETLPARDKAVKKAKLNVIKIKRTCGGFDCACSELHSVPFKVIGKSGSVKVTLIPASQGTGLVVANELKKVLKLAGIKDVYSRTQGRKRTTFNLIKACMNALKKINIQKEITKNE